MCFSASASFSAAAFLAATGIATIHSVKRRNSLFLIALVPILFALQQASEGVLWLELQGYLSGFSSIAKTIYLTFAYLVWPIWIPLALWAAEKISLRKNLLALFLLLGTIWSFYQTYTLASIEPTAQIVHHSIQYTADFYKPERLLTLAYIALVTIPFFISSLPHMWLFGIGTLIAAMITQFFFQETFTSVWCFFASLLSLILYFTLKKAS